jgi:hypothetical protein
MHIIDIIAFIAIITFIFIIFHFTWMPFLSRSLIAILCRKRSIQASAQDDDTHSDSESTGALHSPLIISHTKYISFYSSFLWSRWIIIIIHYVYWIPMITTGELFKNLIFYGKWWTPEKIVENLFSTIYYIEEKKNMFQYFSSYVSKSISCHHDDIAYDILFIRTWYHTWYHNYVISQSDYDTTVKLWYHIWCDICTSCDVAPHHMWSHVWYHIVISQLCDIVGKLLWYHMWNHRQQRDSSHVISHSFFISYVISHVTSHSCSIWYHTVMSHVMSYPCPWLKLQASLLWLPQAQPPRRCLKHKPLANAWPLAATAAGLGGVCGVGGGGGLPCLRRMARGPQATNNVALLHSHQNCCSAGSGQRCQRGRAAHTMMVWSRKPDHAQNRNGQEKPDQRRPKNRISCLDIVQLKHSTELKCLPQSNVKVLVSALIWWSELWCAKDD